MSLLRPAVRSLAILSLCSLFVACAAGAADPGDGDDDEAPGPGTSTAGLDSKAGPELRVRAGEMTLWVDRIAVASRDAGGEPVAVIEGRASRNLVAVSSWVPDDAFGQASLLTQRTFQIELRGGHEVNTLLSGLPIFVSLDSTTGSITHYEGKIVLAPRFASFEGAPELFIDAAVAPVWAGSAEDPLRYHGRVSTTTPADSLSVAAAAADAAPTVTRTGDLEWNLAWSYAPLERAAIPATHPVTFTASLDGRTVTKQASVELQVVEIGLTTADPREAWPSTCDRAVLDCVRAAVGAEDLSACGSYRQVSACRFADPCEIDPQPLALSPIDVSSADDAAAAYTDGCGTGGDWCSLTAVRGFSLPECPLEPPTLEAIFELVRELDQDHSTLEFSFGDLRDRAGAAATPFFSTTYSDGGPGLLGAIDAIAGDAGGEIQAWSVSQQVPCHNCTDFQDTIILYYPATGIVFVVDGGHGFDS